MKNSFGVAFACIGFVAVFASFSHAEDIAAEKAKPQANSEQRMPASRQSRVYIERLGNDKVQYFNRLTDIQHNVVCYSVHLGSIDGGAAIHCVKL